MVSNLVYKLVTNVLTTNILDSKLVSINNINHFSYLKIITNYFGLYY